MNKNGTTKTAKDYDLTPLTKEQQEKAEDEEFYLSRQLRLKINFADDPGQKYKDMIDDGTVENHLDQKMADYREEQERKRQQKKDDIEAEQLR